MGKRKMRRSAARLGAELERGLSAYAVAAAAGVSVIALAPLAQAKIVYTPAHIQIPLNGGDVFLDLNHDGISDFSFANSSVNLKYGHALWLLLRAAGNGQSHEIWGQGSFYVSSPRQGNYTFASALRAGSKVGRSKSHFQDKQPWLMAYGGSSHSSRSFGQWQFTKHRYLGLKFMIGSEIHYGWARFSVTLPGPDPTHPWGIYALLTGYAYETIPNKPIITGKTKGADVVVMPPDVRAATENKREASTSFFPPTLGRLAQGASGISAWRKSAGRWQPAAH